MVGIGILKRLGSRRWSPTFSMMLEHINLAVEIVRDLKEAVWLKLNGDHRASLKKVMELSEKEHNADQLRRRIMVKLTEGVLPPLSRQDLIHLARRLDYIADNAHEAARFLMYADLSRMPEEMRRGIIRLADETLMCVELTARSIEELGRNFAECSRLCDEVERVEEICDELYLELIGRLPNIQGVSPGLLLLIHDLIVSLERVSDSCEDAVDIMRSVVMRVSS